MNTHDPTTAAFARLKRFAQNEDAPLLERMVAETAAGWLALATCYGVTADPWLLAEIADDARHPVARAKTLSRSLVEELASLGIPVTSPFQAVEVLYSEGERDTRVGVEWQPAPNPFDVSVRNGPRP